ncbi:uracil-DNA glycosylase family protein [Oricola thermophila]|uniref:Uracil-DNA glycosylase family protein n=1 Tax=Oricola thermophila TaxID=2742145 RepID=A0A6N1V9N7_9HYPH|nr:uracil-DNA glycosylase family protein [Oricola thermophila]QKV17640.1 uracil-DNA glycosylase family protein [Oricola thermophila]
MTENLSGLLSEIRACRICRDAPRFGAALPHEPNPVCVPSATARICICGQAPGTRVHKSGRPFTDPSGVRLRQWMGVDEQAFYDASRIAIIPMGFCFPGLDRKGGDLPPRRECRSAWHDRLFGAMPQLELVIAVGRYAQAYHMGRKAGPTLTDTVRNWRAAYDAGKPRVLPLPHPSWRNNAWLRKNPWFEEEVLPVLRAEVARLVAKA